MEFTAVVAIGQVARDIDAGDMPVKKGAAATRCREGALAWRR